MATMNREIYEALKEAKVSDDTALRAAESVARLDTLDRDIADIKRDVAEIKGLLRDQKSELKDLGHRSARVESDVNLLKWMVGFNLAPTVAVLFKLFT